jgi:Tfp pilus assembly protein PilN
LKPLHLNLASRPFRDYRPLYAVVVVVSLLIAFLMLNNIDTYYRYVRETTNTRDEIARIVAQAEQERRRGELAQKQIAAIDLATLDMQAKFVNAHLAERAFSWSELLDRLETTLPRDVRVTSIAPNFADDGLVQLALRAEAKESDGMLETITRFQSSPWFTKPFPDSEQNTGEVFRFGLGVQYKPSIPRVVKR